VLDAIDLHDIVDESTGTWRIDRAVLGARVPAETDADGSVSRDDELAGVLHHELDCQRGGSGLRANLSWPGGATAPAVATLYGRQLTIGTMRCGGLLLNHDGPSVAASFSAYFGDARAAAIFSVGHMVATTFDDGGESRALLSQSVFPHEELRAEAARFVATLRPARADGEGRFVAVHWRHGDYVAYKLLTPLDRVVSRVRDALRELRCDDAECPVFLMTNCQDAATLRELAEALPSLVRYEPPPQPARFAEEGPRLVIEQAIAAAADTFLSNPRSAVSQYVVQLRGATGLGARPNFL